MSDTLTNDQDNSQKNAQVLEDEQSSEHLSGAIVIAHLKACQSLTANTTKSFIGRFVAKLTRDLDSLQSEHGLMPDEVALTRGKLKSSGLELARTFCVSIAEGFVRFRRGELNSQLTLEHIEASGDQLTDEAQTDFAFALHVTEGADIFFKEPMWALNQRFAVLNAGKRVDSISNPASPIQLSLAFCQMIKTLAPSAPVRRYLLKKFDEALLDLSGTLVAQLNDLLIEKGILANLKYEFPTGEMLASTVSRQKNDSEWDFGDARSVDHQEKGAKRSLDPQVYQQQLIEGIKNLQARFVGAEKQDSEEQDSIARSELLSALQQLQSDLLQTTLESGDSLELVPIDISKIIEQINSELEKDLNDGEVDRGDMQTIELVGMLFSYMLKDENLPDCIKVILSYLHTPFLKIAFIDPDFFEQSDHPARVLFNLLAEAGARWVNADGSSQFDFLEKISDVVKHVLRDFDDDLRVITTLLLEFSSYTKNIKRRLELMEQRATEKAQGEEKLREVKLQINEEIQSRIVNKDLSSALLLFLIQPWSDYLAFALLRYGEKSDKWIKALALVDDVLWITELQKSDRDRQQQMAMHDEVLDTIRQGFETIGFDHEKGNKLIDAISSLIKLAIQSKRAEPAPAPMRSQLERIAAEKAGSRAAKAQPNSPQEADLLEKLKTIEFGTWFEFSDGKRLKLAWYNARTSHYMFVDQVGKRVDMMTGIDMTRRMLSKDIRIISGSAKPFFERALENILENLNKQARYAKEANYGFNE